jgi:hypothetical protein
MTNHAAIQPDIAQRTIVEARKLANCGPIAPPLAKRKQTMDNKHSIAPNDLDAAGMELAALIIGTFCTAKRSKSVIK